MDHTPLHETKIHGSITFPYNIYRGIIPEWLRSFPLHWHDDFELIYCSEGRMQVTLWGQSYLLCAGDLIVILPHAVHSIEQSGDKSGTYFNLMFHPSLFKGSEDDLCYDKYVLPFLNGEKTMDFFHPSDSPFNRAISGCILSMLAHRKEDYPSHELMVKSNLYFLLHFMNIYSTDADAGSSHLQLSFGKLKNALYYVRNHYDQEVTIKEAAKQCGFSESHFMKLFKEFTGLSFNAYLIEYRLELAAKQLLKTDLKVIDIAENCGFRNHAYFTRAFHKKYGKTPVAYRKAAGPGS